MVNYKLIEARETLGLTQEDFCKLIGIDKTSYSYKENGKRKIWVYEANRMIEELNRYAKKHNINQKYTYEEIFLE